MECCENYHFQISEVAGVADGSLDSLLVNDREIGFGHFRPCLVSKIFKIPRHIESCGICMVH